MAHPQQTEYENGLRKFPKKAILGRHVLTINDKTCTISFRAYFGDMKW